jgi:peptide/nickel transport system substrate-binding protein
MQGSHITAELQSGETDQFNIPTGNTTRESVANVVQSNLTALGLNVQIQKYDFPTIMSNFAARITI